MVPHSVHRKEPLKVLYRTQGDGSLWNPLGSLRNPYNYIYRKIQILMYILYQLASKQVNHLEEVANPMQARLLTQSLEESRPLFDLCYKMFISLYQITNK